MRAKYDARAGANQILSGPKNATQNRELHREIYVCCRKLRPSWESDINAKVGILDYGFERVMGRHGIGSVIKNRVKLKEFCDFYEMVIAGTIFPHKEIHKLTWLSPNKKIQNLDR